MKILNFLKKSSFSGWEQLILSVLGTTISIGLTFGVNSLAASHRQQEARKLAAVRVMGNIESFARELEQVYASSATADTAATFLMTYNRVLQDCDREDLLQLFNDFSPTVYLTHDKSARNIFSSGLEIWQNVDNARFIDNVGQCFQYMDIFEEEYNTWVKRLIDHSNDFLKANRALFDEDLGAYLAAYFQDSETLDLIEALHPLRDRMCYMVSLLRWNNRLNMRLMGISEAEVMDEMLRDEDWQIADDPQPSSEAFVTPLPKKANW